MSVTWQIYVHTLHALYGPIGHVTLWNYCILYHLWLIFCPHCFVFVLSTNFSPQWNQYTDFTKYSLATSYSLSSVECIWSEFSTLWLVESDLLWTLIYTLWSHPCWPGYIKAEILEADQIWQSHRGNDTILQRKTGWQCAAKISVWQGFVRYVQHEINILAGFCMLLECLECA